MNFAFWIFMQPSVDGRMETYMKTAIVIGAGARGKRYSEIANELYKAGKNSFCVVAVAEPKNERRNFVGDMFGVPENMRHNSWETLLEMPKIADIAIIADESAFLA